MSVAGILDGWRRSWVGRWKRLRDRGPRWDEATIWALDLEASGLDPERDCILSVGMVPLRDGRVHWGESWYSLVRPDPAVELTREALKVHHILPDEVVDAPPLEEVLSAVLERLDGGVLLVHYAQLDVGMLRRACRRLDREWPLPLVVDTVQLLSRLSRRRRLIEPHAEPYSTGLQEARRELGLPPHRAHHALGDALATAELFLVARRRLGIEHLGRLS